MSNTAAVAPVRDITTVLLLDDEPMILMDLRFAMEDAGLVALTASTASRAMDAIDKAVPDAAVLDVNLGGGETCEGVARRLTELGVPFLLHSGDLDRNGEVVRQVGVRILPKPTPAHRVAEAVLALK